MGRGLIFPHPARRRNRGGRRWARGRGVRRPRPARATAFDLEAPPTPAAKSPAGTTRRPVPQSDTGVLGEYPKAFGRTLVKELGKLTPYPRYKGCSRGDARAAEDRL